MSEEILTGKHTLASVTEQISDISTRRPLTRGWIFGASVGFLLLIDLLFAITYLFLKGVGIWGIDIPVAWGFAIINFVWWIGIGHAGTFISAILYLVHQEWRTSINRFAEAMTLFAVSCAGIYPLLHLGRPWFAYWVFPYPNTMGLWPQFRSPLIWDAFAVATYATVSLIFWYIGMVPDFASLRDGAPKAWQRITYGVLSLGWRGKGRHWARYQTIYVILAGLATPLVLSVHSLVSMDFTAALLPGWHSTIFPPFFVAGAIFSGFAMVLTLAVPLRKFYGLEDFITIKHIDNCAKLLLVTGLLVVYGYVFEAFISWYSDNQFEKYVAINRALGPYATHYWTLIFCNAISIQLLWFKKIRTSPWILFGLSFVVNIGMWMERFIIIIVSLHRDFIPANWGMYHGNGWDWATFIGTMGQFLFFFFLFIRALPVIAISELRELVYKQNSKKETA
jgi:Ni/Fe-hydrogenase subunit HybB-like protein